MIGKWLARRYRPSDEEVAESKNALARAQQIEQQAHAMKKESARLGDSLRAIQRENHVGQSLTYTYRKVLP